MIASLPMYDWPEVREATDAWWAAIARQLGSDFNLVREGNHTASWSNPDLLFSQTCGYPFTHEFKGKLSLVATPHYGVDGCDGPDYCSLLFASRNVPLHEFRGSRVAVNGPDSMSGMLALKLAFGPFAEHGRFFGSVIRSGGHLNSLREVREGRADVCAVDAVCAAMARRYRPGDLEGLVEVGRSPRVPGLPYVTIAGNPAKLRDALAAAFEDSTARDAREKLFLGGFSVLEPNTYDRITELESAMERDGGLVLL